MDLLLPSRQHVIQRDVADGAVQADIVVMLDVTLTSRRASPTTMAFPAGYTLL
jgi:hypothetical protein